MLPLEKLIKDLSSLPGFGKRSAQRAALSLLSDKNRITTLMKSLKTVQEQVKTCSICANLSLGDPCDICTDTARQQGTICVVEGVDDLWAMERGESFEGVYHVLGGVISAIDGVGVDDIRINTLITRVQEGDIDEVILALGASVDGGTTSHLIARYLKDTDVKVTTLARGMPMGAEVDYMDAGTLAMALKGRITY
ncbi:MAG: recombination protein RecR [Alphaproteobacteria bacterium]|jgi:recombination protein RecR